MNVEKFDWTEELHQTMVKSLVTSFGLDFLLLNDRKGGDVDTIHNVRNGIYATEAERQRYEGRGDYDSHHYHSHENYIATNRKGKRAHQSGTLTDAYTGEVFASDDKKIWIILFPLKKFMMIRGEFLLNGMVQNWQMTLQIWHSLMSRSINQRKQTQWMRLFARCRKTEKIR